MKTTYKIGQVVGVKGRRGHVDCAIASIRRIQRGRRAGMMEYTLSPMLKQGKTYAHVVIGESLFTDPKQKWSEDEAKQAIARMRADDDQVQSVREERKQRGRDAIGDVDMKRNDWWMGPSGTNIGVGDEVLVRYTNVPARWEKVGAINFQSGKVGIKRRGFEDDLITQAKAMVYGRKGRRRDIRWIHPDSIIDVRSPSRKIPFTITDRALEKMATDGWHQIIHMREFIESSYVVAFTKELARKGNTYDTSDHTIYQDPDLGVYWRDTGCFD